MAIFYEKADENLIKKCENFIKMNCDSKNDYDVYRTALHLYTKLMDSLLESHKPFDEMIKEKNREIYRIEDGVKQYAFACKFNQEENRLILDVKAHEIMRRLSEIENNQRI